jgi:hypothetical protein
MVKKKHKKPLISIMIMKEQRKLTQLVMVGGFKVTETALAYVKQKEATTTSDAGTTLP